MKYSRVRNSHYANYARKAGRTAQFAIPTKRTANFNPMLDMLGQAGNWAGDMYNQVGQYIPDVSMPSMPNIPNPFTTQIPNAGPAIDLQGAADTFQNLPLAGKAGVAATGGAALGGAAALGKDAMRRGGQVAEQVADVAQTPGLRQRAMALLRNPKALGYGALGAGAIGAGALGANALMNRDSETM